MANHPLLAGVDAEEQIEDNADNGYEPYHQRPRHCLGGLPVIHYNVDNSQYDNDVVDDGQYQVQHVFI